MYNYKTLSKSNIGLFEYSEAIKILDNYYKKLYTIAKQYDNKFITNPTKITDRIIMEYWPICYENIDKILEFIKNYGIIHYVRKIKVNYNMAKNMVFQRYGDYPRFKDEVNEKVKFIGFEQNNNKYM